MDIDITSRTKVRGVPLPDRSSLVGYAALIEGLGVSAPLPDPVAVVSEGKARADKGRNHALRDGFAVYERSYGRESTFENHLLFALKYERTDLLALKRIFDRTPPEVMEEFVRAAPTGSLRRQGWFFYEWLTQRRLDLPDSQAGNYVDALDPEKWYVARGISSPRHRVRDNLPGTPGFCALVSRDADLSQASPDFAASQVAALQRREGDETLRRVARRLLLKDSKSTYQIESENPSPQAIAKWAEAVRGAGSQPLTEKLLVDLQGMMFKDRRFIVLGRRREGVFLGDRIDNVPVPNWIGARPQDIGPLLDGLFAAHQRLLDSEVPPVAHAAILSFGLIYIHAFQDGNGRLSRYALQHVLAERGMVPSDVVLPVSKAIWRDVDGYHEVFKANDAARMPFIEWSPTHNGNVVVGNDTADLYRFTDMTREAAFMAQRVAATLKNDLPKEIVEVRQRDRAVSAMRQVVEMPDNEIERLMVFIFQNGGVLSRNRRRKDYAELSDDEVAALEDAVRDAYDMAPPAPEEPEDDGAAPGMSP